MNGSEVCFVGTLGRAPELRFTQSGRAVANASMACSRRYKKDDEWVEDTCWWNLVIWGEQGEQAAASLDKGSRVIVTGRLQQRKWETEEGETRYATDLIVDEIAASLRWATVVIEKTERTKGDGGYYSSQDPADYASGGFTDEEPFVFPASIRDAYL